MKRLFVSLLLLLLASPVLAQPSVLPADERFDAPVRLQAYESLATTIETLASAIGLTAILNNVPETAEYYNIDQYTPFRLVFENVLALHNLDFLLRGENLIIIAPAAEIQRLRELDSAALEVALNEEEEAFRSFYPILGDAVESAEFLRSALPGVSVDVMPGGATLMVDGTATQHAGVQDLLDRFDSAAPQVVVEMRTYRLANALAADLAGVLAATQAALFTTVEAEDAEAMEAAAASQDLFTVSADARTNSLIVIAPPFVQDQISQLLPDLDVRQEQVNVQVRIQEIQTRAANRVGINMAGSLGQFSANFLEGGLSFIFDPHAAVSAFNLGAVLDTLETQGLSRRVDDSSLTVLNNTPTSIQAGGTIMISLPGASENIERTIPYGVQIDVTPRVAADGRITLSIEAKVEDVLSTLEDPTLLELSTRAVQSTITLDPGQTVLLSGLMQNQYIESVNQVPLLGSLPIIGGLFRNTVTELSETELLIIVTADILD